ncbi:hypothetical protein DBR06_SOUSAS3110123 [Sousa chinensis]|nr:hypothetical protein DBR06_SOUSAS3110123 [Sousa chinensis]
MNSEHQLVFMRARGAVCHVGAPALHQHCSSSALAVHRQCTGSAWNIVPSAPLWTISHGRGSSCYK